MSRTVLASDMIAQAREAADMVGSDFRSDTQILRMINAAAPELWGLLVENYGDEYLASTRILATVAGTSSYAMEGTDPGTGTSHTDVLKVLRVLVDFGSNRMLLSNRFNPADREIYSTLSQNWQNVLPRYFVSGANIEFEYAPQAAHTVRIVYIPSCPVLALATAFDGYNGWERYVVTKVAAQLLAMEESDNSVLLMELAGMKQRIESESNHRDAGNAPTVGLTRSPRYIGRRVY